MATPMFIVFSSSARKRSTQPALGLVTACHVLVATCALFKTVARVRPYAVLINNLSTVVIALHARGRVVALTIRSSCAVYSHPLFRQLSLPKERFPAKQLAERNIIKRNIIFQQLKSYD